MKKKFSLNFINTFAICVVAFVIISAIASTINLFLSSLSQDKEENLVADGFTIEEYNVVLDVQKNNLVYVTENITVNFLNAYKHGIYKFTSYWLPYTGKDGKTIKRKANIINYIAVNDTYTTDIVNKKERIKIGSASSYVGKGYKTYQIKYTYDMGSDPFKGFDEFIFHAYGDYWNTEIRNASIEVIMPTNIENYPINFYLDKKRQNNVNNAMDYTVEANTISAKFNDSKNFYYQYAKQCPTKENCDFDYQPLKKSLTVDIELPEGYFSKGSYNYGFVSLTMCLITFILTTITFFKWFKYGKDYEKQIATIEFYPPDNLTPAEIGYVYNKFQDSKKLTVSLIIELASKGYIKIDELKDENDNIKITNLYPKPIPVKSFLDTVPKRKITIQKLKESDENLSTKEQTMMKYLFRKESLKELTTNINKFLEVKDNLVNKGYIKIINDNELTRLSNDNQKEYNKEVAKYNKNYDQYLKNIKALPTLSELEKIVYDALFTYKDEVILSEHYTFYKVFDEIHEIITKEFQPKIYEENAKKQIKGSIIREIIVLILSIVAYRYVEDLDPRLNILYYLAFFSNIINIILIIFMNRKSKYGQLISAKVKGFRDFLVNVEKDKLEALVKQNPRYFYDILPYTYVLNISKTWINRFENFPIPIMDMGNFDFSNDYSYYSIYNNVYRPIEINIKTSSGSGCSSCGGGCSSCGGGCSSCGGGGSW